MPGPKNHLVAVGGAAGSACRWAIDNQIGPTAWPWALLVVNVGGSFVLGLVIMHGATGRREQVRLVVGVGFCGGLTTFSSFAVASADLMQAQRFVDTLSFVSVSVLLAAVAMVTGMWTRSRWVTV